MIKLWLEARRGTRPVASAQRSCCTYVRTYLPWNIPAAWPVVTELVAEHVVAELVPSLSCG
jgi:hypothetical protein